MSDFPRPILAVHQPNYAPWLGYFVKACTADRFVLLDDVQFPKASWVNRTRVLADSGPEFLTIPVKHPGLSLIKDVRIADPKWVAKHGRKIRSYYQGAPGLGRAEEVLDPEGLAGVEGLADVNEVLLRRLLRSFGATAEVVRSSTLGVAAADPTERHIALCRRLGAKTYLSGQGASAYNEEGRFKEAGIALAYLRFDHPVYPQRREPFTPGLSALDIICALGGSAGIAMQACVRTAVLEATSDKYPRWGGLDTDRSRPGVCGNR